RVPDPALPGVRAESVAAPVVAPQEVAPGSAQIASPPARARISEEQIQQELRASFAEAIYLPAQKVELRKSFVELGLDSIVGVEWIRHVNKKFDLAMPATRLYDYPTIAAFAHYLAGQIGAEANTEPAP